MSAEARIPVIVGVGQVNDRPSTLEEGHDSVGLMIAAARAADEDAGCGWLEGLTSVATVAQISFPSLGDVAQKLAHALGASPSVCYQTKYPSGDSPILLLNEAANRIAAGEIETALIAGGEALRTAAQRAAAGAGVDAPRHNATRALSERHSPDYRQRYGLVAPVDIYPLYENATRAAWGQSLAEAQRESGEIWARFSEVAVQNEGAWLRKAVAAETVTQPSSDNRPIAFPYTKLMVANSSVNQGAAFIVTSMAQARRRGIEAAQLVYAGAGAAAREPGDILARDGYVHSPSMAASLTRGLELNALEANDLDFAELYSCFPCVPKMARRIIGWPLEKPATVFGGLTFGGGPIANYMSHAVVSMVQALRRGGRHGLLFGNGGLATTNHTIVLSRDRERAIRAPQNFDVQADADAQRGPVPPHIENYVGAGYIETYTVLYERDGRPRFGVIVGRSPEGARFLAKILPDDEAGIAFLTDGAREPIGSKGEACAGPEGDVLWRVA